MKHPLRLTHKQFAEVYGELCDVICREDLNISDEDPYHHTSDVARRKAMAIVDRLTNVGYLEYR